MQIRMLSSSSKLLENASAEPTENNTDDQQLSQSTDH